MRTAVLGILLSSSVALAEPSAAPVNPPASAPATRPAAPRPAGPAAATGTVARGNGLSLVAVSELPESCRDLGKLADSPSPPRALSARISLASCLVEARVKLLVLCDCEQSVREITEA